MAEESTPLTTVQQQFLDGFMDCNNEANNDPILAECDHEMDEIDTLRLAQHISQVKVELAAMKILNF